MGVAMPSLLVWPQRRCFRTWRRQAIKLVQDNQKQVNAELERKREKKRRRELGLDKEEEDAKVRNIGIAAGAAALSLPLFGDNLQRLFIKGASGGKDDGYGKIPAR